MRVARVRRRVAVPLAATLLALPAAAGPDKTGSADRGRDLFLGLSGQSVRVSIDGLGTTLARLPCAGCHGRDAAGRREGSGAAPSVEWRKLSAPARGKDAYRQADFERALSDGKTPSGRALASRMPRYEFDRHDLDDLLAFLGQVDRREREGLAATTIAISLDFPPALSRTAAVFGDGFRAGVAAAAPNGVFGRRLVLTENAGAAFIRLGERVAPEGETPVLFPFAGVVGDEDAFATRGAFASAAKQVGALLDEAGAGRILFGDDPRSRAIHRAVERELSRRPGWTVGEVADGATPAGRIVVVAQTQAIPELVGTISGTPEVFGLADQLGPLAATLAQAGYRGRLAYPRLAGANDAESATDAYRYGRTAAFVVLEAFKRCSRACGRTRFMESIDGLTLEPAGWPKLDFGAEPLTGSTNVVVLPWP